MRPTKILERLAISQNSKALQPPIEESRIDMKELLRTNNTVYLSFAQAVLKGEGIQTQLFDAHMSVMDGSIGALPRRLMVVHDEQYERAKQILAEAEPKEES